MFIQFVNLDFAGMKNKKYAKTVKLTAIKATKVVYMKPIAKNMQKRIFLTYLNAI